MNAVECLVAARKRLENPENWGKGADLADREKTCALLAMCVTDRDSGAVASATRIFRNVVNSQSIATWNDAPERTHAEVLAAFDKAIELANV